MEIIRRGYMLTNLRIWKLSEHITHLPKLSSASNMQTKSITVFISQPTDSRKRAKKIHFQYMLIPVGPTRFTQRVYKY